MDAEKTWLRTVTGAALALAAIIALPYLTSLRYGFVYDDHGAIVENAFLADASNVLDVVTLKTLRDPHVLDGRRPVVLLSYFLDRAVWGLRPGGWHLTNLLLHLGVVALFVTLVYRLTGSIQWAFVTALLFGLHPAMSEAVHVPAFREDLLCGLFAMACLLPAASRRPSILFMLVSFAFALGSKESAAVIPLLIAWLWICFPERRLARSRMGWILAAMVALAVIFLLVCFVGRPVQAATGVWNGLSLRWPDNLLTLPWLWIQHLRILLCPYPLSADYVVDPVQSMIAPRFTAGALALLLVGGLAAFLVRRRPMLTFGLGWMLLAFLPVSNLVPLFNPLADRYVYFLAPGFVMALAAALPQRFHSALALTGCLVYAMLLMNRLPHWQDDMTLWMRTLQTEPRSARAHAWLGIEFKQRGESDAARQFFEEADRLNPQDVSALVNLAVLDGQAGDLVGAEARLREAVRRRPDKADAHWNLAMTLRLQGREDEAREFMRETVRLDPNHPQARSVLEE